MRLPLCSRIAARRVGLRRGLSLLELLAVATLMGIFSSLAMMRLGRDIFGDAGARSEARRMSLGMLAAQRAAIRTGLRHGIQLHQSGGRVLSWSVVKIQPNGRPVIVDGPMRVPDELDVRTSTSEVLFDFEGNGTTSATIDFVGPHRHWRIVVMPLTRMIDCREVR